MSGPSTWDLVSKGVRLHLVGGAAVTGAFAAARHLGTNVPNTAECMVTADRTATGPLRHAEASAGLTSVLLAEPSCDYADGHFVHDGMRLLVRHASDALDQEAVAMAEERVGMSDDARDTMVATPEHVVALALRDGEPADGVVAALIDADFLLRDVLDAILERHGIAHRLDEWTARAGRAPSP